MTAATAIVLAVLGLGAITAIGFGIRHAIRSRQNQARELGQAETHAAHAAVDREALHDAQDATADPIATGDDQDAGWASLASEAGGED